MNNKEENNILYCLFINDTPCTVNQLVFLYIMHGFDCNKPNEKDLNNLIDKGLIEESLPRNCNNEPYYKLTKKAKLLFNQIL